MRLGLYVNQTRDHDLACTRRLVGLCKDLDITCSYDPNLLDFSASIPGLLSEGYEDCDFLVSLGGDGTFLRTIHLGLDPTLPRWGINLGSVGFLPEVEPEDLELALDALKAGRYSLEKRLLLYFQSFNAQGELEGQGPALNDVVIQRGSFDGLIRLQLYLDQELIYEIPGDGLIVSSPTGSTAYSLAAGGPILHPTLPAFLVTPIAPHTLWNQSFVLASETQIKMVLGARCPRASLSADGTSHLSLRTGSYVVVKKAPQDLSMVHFEGDHFFLRLPQKLRGRNQ